MTMIASWITSLTVVYLSVYSGTDQRKYQSSATLAFVQGIHRGPVNSPHKWPVTRKMFPFDDVIMCPLKYGVKLLIHSQTSMVALSWSLVKFQVLTNTFAKSDIFITVEIMNVTSATFTPGPLLCLYRPIDLDVSVKPLSEVNHNL